MSLTGRKVIKRLLILTCIISSFLSMEIYLQQKENKIESPGNQLTFCTHAGAKISKGIGLKMAIAPFTIYKNFPNQKTSTCTINSLGYRGGEISKSRNHQKRIIIVGGSCAFGHSLKNDNETVAALLEKYNNRYEVINAAVNGFHSGEELTHIVTELVDYHPDIIIAFDGWNDLFFSWYHYLWFGRLREKEELGFNCNIFMTIIESQLIANYQAQTGVFYSFRRFFNTLIHKSFIMSWIQDKLTAITKKPAKIQSVESIQGNDYLNEIIDKYTSNIKKMQVFCNSLGIKFLVAFQPELGSKSNLSAEELTLLSNGSFTSGFGIDNYSKEFTSLYRRFIELSKTILKKNGVDYIDINMNPEFKNSSNTVFSDVVHTNKDGNEIIAKILNERLKGIF